MDLIAAQGMAIGHEQTKKEDNALERSYAMRWTHASHLRLQTGRSSP